METGKSNLFIPVAIIIAGALMGGAYLLGQDETSQLTTATNTQETTPTSTQITQSEEKTTDTIVAPEEPSVGKNPVVVPQKSAVNANPAPTATTKPPVPQAPINVSPTPVPSAPVQPSASKSSGQEQTMNTPACPNGSCPPATNFTPDALFTSISPKLAFISCSFYNNYGAVLFTKEANGLLGPMATNGTYFINTDLWAVTDTQWAGYLIWPHSCEIQFPAGANLYAGGYSQFTEYGPSSLTSPVNSVNTNIDYGQIHVISQNTYLAIQATSNNYCSSRPSINEPIVIMGWPTGEKLKMLTGTITRYSDYFDRTDIKLPEGMVGSTAFSLTSGCIIGQVSSDGAIADMHQLSFVLGF